jgi:hypothetical protein
MDSSRTLRELDFSFRDLEESFVDSLSWMHQAGHLSAVQAGSLAVDAEMRLGR